MSFLVINNKWFCEPNPYRQSYCFFYIERKNEDDQDSIKGWKSGIGNINKISKKNKKNQGDEMEIIKALIPHIKTWRKNNILVITEKEEIFPLLRTRIAALGIDEMLLSPLNSISLQHLINRYLLYHGDESISGWCTFLHIPLNNQDEPVLLRQILQRIIGLIPQEELP